MALSIGPSQHANSSSTPPVDRTPPGAVKHASEGFSAVMRAKQETGRLGVNLPVGGQDRESFGVDSESSAPGGKPVGPWGDPVPPPLEREEFHHYGRDSVAEELAPDPLSPWIDPLARVIAHSTPATESAPSPTANPAFATDQMWRAVRRLAWGGDRQRSVAYIELGAGELNGAALTLEARGDAISIVLDLPAGVSRADWAERLADRLARRGLEVRSVEVR